MKRQSADLRQAFAANPTRFLASASRQPIEGQHFRQATFAPQMIGVQTNSVSDQLRRLGLQGMARALSRMETDPFENTMSFTQWLSRLVENEIAERKEQRIASRLRSAKLRYQASMADLDYNALRGFDDALFHWLATGRWIVDRENVILEGSTGVGKTWLACALGDQACRDDHSVRYERVPELIADLKNARKSGRRERRMRALHNAELLILDDWGIEPFGPEQRCEILEILEHRYGRSSTLIATQVPMEQWPQMIGDTTIAAMTLDRIVPNSHHLQLRGESLRKQQRMSARTVVDARDETSGVPNVHLRRM